MVDITLTTSIDPTTTLGSPQVSITSIDVVPGTIIPTTLFESPAITIASIDINIVTITSTTFVSVPEVDVEKIDILPNGISSTLILGDPEIVIPSPVIVDPVSISPTTIFGTPSLIITDYDITVQSIEPTTTFESYSVTFGGSIVSESILSNTTLGVPGLFVTDLSVVVVQSPVGRTYLLDDEERTFVVKASNTNMKFIDKDPSANLNYSFDLSEWLETNDEIESFLLSASDNLTLISQDATTTVITAVVSGGAPQGQESLTCTFTTTNGYTDERTIVFRMGNR